MSHACRLPSFSEMLENLYVCSLLTRCTIPFAGHAKRHLNVQKCSVPVNFLHFWPGNVLRATTCHNDVHFLNISTSKGAPRLTCFGHVDFEMCFVPQRRALFEHLNFQQCSEPVSFSHFWPPNVLRTTRARTFSTSQLPKVVWPWCVLYILTSKRASRHNGVQLFISHLARWPRTYRFSEPTFRLSGATNHWKNTGHLLSSDSFSSLIFSLLLFSLTLPISAFHLSILSEVWLLNFLRL